MCSGEWGARHYVQKTGGQSLVWEHTWPVGVENVLEGFDLRSGKQAGATTRGCHHVARSCVRYDEGQAQGKQRMCDRIAFRTNESYKVQRHGHPGPQKSLQLSPTAAPSRDPKMGRPRADQGECLCMGV